MHSQPDRPQGQARSRGFFRKPGTVYSPHNETDIQLPDQEKFADVETALLRTGQVLGECVEFAAHQTLAAIIDRTDRASTGQLAEIAYAYACLEGARRGALPSTPPAGTPRAASTGFEAAASRTVSSAQHNR
jgi:hypothetical protein